jgi:hypothetical protein
MSEIQEVFRKGCLIDLDVGVWPAERKLQPEDLGLSKGEVPDTFSLGHKRLIPAEATSKIRRVENLGRITVTRYSFPFPFGGARFVPRTQLQECTDQLDGIISTFNAVADSIVADYDKHRLSMRAEFTQAAHAAFHRRMLLCGNMDVGEDEYVNEFLKRIDSVYPSAVDLRRKYHMEYVVFQVELPDLTRATYADIVEDAAKIDLMRRAYEQSIRQRVESFAETVVVNMREGANDVLGRAIKTMKFGKRPTKYTVDMVRKMINRYGGMDLVGDTEFKGRLLDFKARVLDVYKDADIVSDKELRDKVVTELEALQVMASDSAAIRQLVGVYRKELVCI